MTEVMQLDLEVLDGYRERFLARMPDFADFTLKEGKYWKEEREYKDETSAMCRSLLPPSLFEPGGEYSAEKAYQSVLQVLTAKLKSTKQPQNIVGWRHAAALREFSLSDKSIMAESLGRLLYDSEPIGEKIDNFSLKMWPVFKGNKRANPFARSRTFPTFFLMMTHPKDHVAVRTDLFDDVSVDLLGRSILDNQVFTGCEYIEILSLVETVKGHLERWGWCPSDLIDVHSFLWTACWEYEDEPDQTGDTE